MGKYYKPEESQKFIEAIVKQINKALLNFGRVSVAIYINKTDNETELTKDSDIATKGKCYHLKNR